MLRRMRSFGSVELWEPLRKAGYAKPTALQRQVVPLIMSGRDVAVEVEGDSGKTAAFILPILARLKRGKAGIKAVVVTSSAADSRKVKGEFERFGRVHLLALGMGPSDRSEYRSLSRQPDIVVGVPARIIDHIRRGNLDFSHLQSVVIDRQEAHAGFNDDLRFIFSKLPQKKQTILFSPAFGPDLEPLLALLKRPVQLPLASWRRSAGELTELYIEVPESGKLNAASALALAEPPEALLVQCAPIGTRP